MCMSTFDVHNSRFCGKLGRFHDSNGGLLQKRRKHFLNIPCASREWMEGSRHFGVELRSLAIFPAPHPPLRIGGFFAASGVFHSFRRRSNPRADTSNMTLGNGVNSKTRSVWVFLFQKFSFWKRYFFGTEHDYLIIFFQHVQ